jgi:hypothetical protein
VGAPGGTSSALLPTTAALFANALFLFPAGPALSTVGAPGGSALPGDAAATHLDTHTYVASSNASQVLR